MIVGDYVHNDNKDKAEVFSSFFTRISSLENHLTVPYNLDHIIIYDSDVHDILTQLARAFQSFWSRWY